LHPAHRPRLYHRRPRLVNRNPHSRCGTSPAEICAEESIAVRWRHCAAFQIDLPRAVRPEPG
jgi:hypothetical protein